LYLFYFTFFYYNFKILGEKGSLKNYIKKNPQLDFDIKLKILTEISKGMEYLHFVKVIHRDLKPDNILLTRGKILKKIKKLLN
jgi:serine/threonine protein kinase